MARPAASNVVVQWTGTGTGTLSLGSAIPGSQGFPSALSGFKLSYSIEHENGVERESGLGTYTSSGNTLSRDLVDFSTAGGTTKQNFTAGNKFVRLTIMPRDIIEDRRTTVPGLTDDISAGYIEGRSRVLNTATGAIYMCRSHAVGAAVWDRINPIASSGGILPPTSIITTNYQILVTDGPVRTDTTSAGFQVTAPVAPTDGQLMSLEDAAEGGSWSVSKPVTLVTSDGSTLAANSGAGGVAHDGGTTAIWRYNAASGDWAYVGEAGGGSTSGGGTALGALNDGGVFVPASINLSSSAEYNPYAQTGALAFALAAVTEVPGAEAWVQFTGNSSAITWSSDFAAADGASLTGGEYAGFVGTKRLALRWSGTQGKALVLLSGVSQIDETLTGVATTASRTLGLSDAGRRIIEANHATVAIVLTVPPNSTTAFPISTLINIERTGAAAVSVAAGAGVTVNKSADRTLAIRAQWEVITLRKTATNIWVAFGALGAA